MVICCSRQFHLFAAMRANKYADIDYVRQTLRERAVCVLIPTYNNVGTIRSVVIQAKTYCHDVIVVDDGSTDGTTDVLKSISGIQLVSYQKNRGKGYALKCGFKHALSQGFAYAITMDADGQHFAKDIPVFLKANVEWPGSIILGNQNLDNVSRTKGSSFANRFSNFWFSVETGKRMPDTQTGFRLYPLKKLYGYRLLTSRYEAELELIVFASWHGVKIHSVPIDVYYPPADERVSHFRAGRDFTRISVLNTLLCLLAVVYGLPLYLWRTLATTWRTIGSLLFFLVFMMLIINPYVFVYVKTGRMTERKRRHLHRIIYRSAKLITQRIGIPGAKYSKKVDPSVNFNTPSIIICNHQSHFDLIYLLSLSPNMIFLTNDWVWNNPFYGFLIRHAEYYPASSGIDTLMPRFRSLVSRGYSIAIFPEGTRSADCKIARFHQGAFYVAEQLGIGVTPIILYGTGRVLRKKTYHLEKSPVYMEAGRQYTQTELRAKGGLLEQTRFFHSQYLKCFEKISNKMEQDV